jgi:hypothetical protein
MRHFLLFTTILLLIVTVLHSPAVRTQEAQKGLPNPADYPAAESTCKNKVKLSPGITVPGVDAPKTFRCELVITTCKGRETYRSDVRARRQTMCNDYWAVHHALRTVAICCDPGSKPDSEEKKKKNCDPLPPPWFRSQDCIDLQDPQIEFTRDHLAVYLCGYKIFSRNKETADNSSIFTDPLFAQAYKRALLDQLSATVPRKVCCNRFREAAATGKPCNSRADADCDGKPNELDVLAGDPDLPQIDGRAYTIPSSTNVDPVPAGLTEDAIMPPEQCKDCKWELIKAVLKCNPNPNQRHSYETTWRCPPTDAEVEVVRYSPPGVGCITR